MHKFDPKIQNCSKRSLIQRLIRICRIKLWCPFYLFLTRNTVFWGTLFGQIWSKNSKLSVWAENWYKNQFEYQEFSGDVYFSCFQLEVSFFWKFVLHLKIFCWSCNLEPRLIRICRIQCWFSFCLEWKYPVEKLFKKQSFSNFFKIGFPKNFAIFRRKQLCWILLIKLWTWKPAKRLQRRCFHMNFAKFS